VSYPAELHHRDVEDFRRDARTNVGKAIVLILDAIESDNAHPADLRRAVDMLVSARDGLRCVSWHIRELVEAARCEGKRPKASAENGATPKKTRRPRKAKVTPLRVVPSGVSGPAK
jgi:hypothetical protein